MDHMVEDSPDLLTWNRVSSELRPSGGVLNWSHVQFDLSYFGIANDLYITPTSRWGTRRFYRIRELPAADAAPVVSGAAVPKSGRLTQPIANGRYLIKTLGNWSVSINGTNLIVTNPAGTARYEIWGDGSGGTGHENLNGKHLKDMLGGYRTLLLPDGTIITVTLSTTPGKNTIDRFSIYDGEQSHRLTTYPDGLGNPNTVTMSASLRRAGEALEPDGETCRLLNTPNGMHVENIYNQTGASDGQPLPQEAVPLGTTGGPANPNQVNDYYDDPRLAAT